jgi:drug/metabolite transporter (DMT)-like permease
MRTGPLLMIAATLVLTAMSGAVKIARVDMSTLDLVFWRGVVSVPAAWLMARSGGLQLHNRRAFGFRLGFGFLAMMCFFTALKGLPLADTNCITKIQPVLIGLLAPVVLGSGERSSLKLWLFMGVGATGTAVLLAPGLAVGSVWGLWALGAAVLSAAAHLALRALKDDASGAVVFWFQLGVMGLSGLWVLLRGEGLSLPPAHIWPAVVAVGLLATAGQLLMTHAYARDTATSIAAVRFVGPIWGVAGDVLFFGGWPAPHVWAGGALVVGAGIAVTLSPTKSPPQ